MSKLLLEGRRRDAGSLLKDYMEWFGPDSVYVELQRNYLQGDAELARASVGLALNLGVPTVASNDVHYHHPDRYRLQHALVAAGSTPPWSGPFPTSGPIITSTLSPQTGW